MQVKETFFGLAVTNMERAATFYAQAFGATVAYSSERWSSLIIAGVRLGLALKDDHDGDQSGLHFVVDDLQMARNEVMRAGGNAFGPREIVPGLRFVEATDTEGNSFLLWLGPIFLGRLRQVGRKKFYLQKDIAKRRACGLRLTPVRRAARPAPHA